MPTTTPRPAPDPAPTPPDQLRYATGRPGGCGLTTLDAATLAGMLGGRDWEAAPWEQHYRRIRQGWAREGAARGAA